MSDDTLLTKNTDFVMLRRYRDLPEAAIFKSILGAESIDCVLSDENMVRMDWFWSNLLGGVKLWVRQQDLENAKELIDQESPENAHTTKKTWMEMPLVWPLMARPWRKRARGRQVLMNAETEEVDFSSPVVGSANLRTETIPLAVESLTGPPTTDAGGLLLVPPKPSLDLCSGYPLYRVYRVKPNVKFDLVKSLKLS
jgi:putative signal transducing protein